MNKRETINNIIQVAMSNIAKLVCGVFVGFLLPKLIGVADYGYYKTFTLYASYVGLFAIGITDGVYLKYGGNKYEDLDRNKFRFISRSYFVIEIVITLALGIFTIYATTGELQFIFACLSVYTVATNVTGYFQIVSQITSRFKELATRNLIQSVLTIGITIIMFIMHLNHINVNYRIYIILYTLVIFCLSIWYIVTYKDIIFGRYHFRGSEINSLFGLIKLGFPLLVANLCSSFILTIDRQFVNILFTNNEYAIYAFAYNMLSLITTATAAISTVIYPTMKKMDLNQLYSNYSALLTIIIAFLLGCLTIYFPLIAFIEWFLPNYAGSLMIFRIILPGLAIQSSITIIMHNYYKTLGFNKQFFYISIAILFISAIANYCAYELFKSTISISVASIIVLTVWFLLTDIYLRKKMQIKGGSYYLYLFSLISVFYIVTTIQKWYISMFLYIAVLFIASLLLWRKEKNHILNFIK